MTIKQFFADLWLCFAILGAIAGGLFPFYLIFEVLVWLLS